jgi:hypothetical protein
MKFTILLWRSAKCLVHSLRRCSEIPKARKPLTLTHMDNARVYTARATQEKLDVSRAKCTSQPPDSEEIAPSDFFFSVGWKPSVNGENIMGKMNYMKSWMKFWQLSQARWSKGFLSTGWIDSNAWLMEMVHAFLNASQMNFWTELNNGKHARIER